MEMKVLQKYISLIDNNNGIPTPEIISGILLDGLPIATEALRRWRWYDGPGDPIFTRTEEQTIEGAIDNRINSAFPARIVNTKVGYLFGNPQTVSLDGDQYTDDQKKLVTDFRADNDMSDLDIETGRFDAACGWSGRLLRIETDPETKAAVVRTTLIEPWLCLFLSDGEIYASSYALRFWYEERTKNVFTRVVRFYTPTLVFQFEGEQNSPGVSLVGKPEGEPHGFIHIPLIGYSNNRELRHDYYLGEEKIMAHARCISNIDSELENERLGYLILQDVEVSSAERQKFKKTGALQVKSSSSREAKIYFLEKNLNPAIYDMHLKNLEQGITSDCGHVDWNDEQFGSGIAGVALRYKLTPLENKSIIAQEKHLAADRQMYWLMCGFWNQKGGNKIDYRDIKSKWTRNLPPNVAEEIDNVTKAKGVVSDLTAYSLAPSVIPDPEKEKESFDNDNPTVQLGWQDDGAKGQNAPSLDDDGQSA